MAKLDDFDVFGGATPPVAPSAQGAPETPAEAPATKETGGAPKRRQGAAQRRTAATQPEVTEPPVAPEPDPAPDDEPELPPLTRAQEARWELVLQSAAGKVRATREAHERALSDWRELVVEARAARASEWTVQAAALRGRISLDDVPDA